MTAANLEIFNLTSSLLGMHSSDHQVSFLYALPMKANIMLV